jgi:hypothetical protein
MLYEHHAGPQQEEVIGRLAALDGMTSDFRT